MEEKYKEYEDERCHNFVQVNGTWQHVNEFRRKNPERWRSRGLGIMSVRKSDVSMEVHEND